MPAEPAALAVPEVAVPAASPRARRWPVFPLGIIGLFMLVALLTPLLDLADPNQQTLRDRFKPPA